MSLTGTIKWDWDMDFRGRIVKKKKISTWIQGTETAHPPTIGVLCHNPPNTSFSNT